MAEFIIIQLKKRAHRDQKTHCHDEIENSPLLEIE